MRDRREWGQAGFSLFVLACPWAYLVWATRPGAERPLLSDVAFAFFFLSLPVLQSGIERAMATRRPAPAGLAIGMIGLSHAGLAFRLRDVSIFLFLSAATLAMALLVFGANLLIPRLFRRSREVSS